MPVEINELVIRANITSPQSAQQATVPVNDDPHKLQHMLDEVLKKISERDER